MSGFRDTLILVGGYYIALLWFYSNLKEEQPDGDPACTEHPRADQRKTTTFDEEIDSVNELSDADLKVIQAICTLVDEGQLRLRTGGAKDKFRRQILEILGENDVSEVVC
jgi:hypothetical protein